MKKTCAYCRDHGVRFASGCPTGHPTTAVIYVRWRSVDHQLVTALLIGIRNEKRGNYIYRRSRFVAVSRMKSQGLTFFKKDKSHGFLELILVFIFVILFVSCHMTSSL